MNATKEINDLKMDLEEVKDRLESQTKESTKEKRSLEGRIERLKKEKTEMESKTNELLTTSNSAQAQCQGKTFPLSSF